MAKENNKKYFHSIIMSSDKEKMLRLKDILYEMENETKAIRNWDP